MKALIYAKDLKRIIQATKKFTSQNTTKLNHRFIRLEFSKEYSLVTAVAVDGYRLAIEHASCANVDEDFSAYILADIPKPGRIEWYAIEVLDGVCYIKIGDSITGYKQPEGEFLDYRKTIQDITKDDPNFKIGFNGNYLITALQAAQASCGGSFKQPVVLEFRSPVEPVVLRTNKDDMKIVLPVRIKSSDENA